MNGTYQCKYCHSAIGVPDVNVATDLALCRTCGKTMTFSGIASIPDIHAADFTHPPKGVRIDEEFAGGRTVTYRKVSPVVWFLIPFTALWSGMSMFGIYGKQLQRGAFNLHDSLFGLPFLIGTVVLVSVILFLLFGGWRIRFALDVCEVSVGVGPFRWTRRQSYDRNSRVSLQTSSVRVNNVLQEVICLETGDQSLKFGSLIREDAKLYIAAVVRQTLAGI